VTTYGNIVFSCWIPGDPFGKAVTGGRGKQRFKDAKTVSYMNRCIFAMDEVRNGLPAIDAPVRIDITAFFRRKGPQIPKVGPRIRTEQPPMYAFPCDQKPDFDNISKGICDSLKQAGVITDDCRATTGHIDKWWVAMSPEHGPTDIGVLVGVSLVDPRARFGGAR
jgi:Holliday junction resolvase RusA-like endonuclease